ncbi:TetR/AcrR family transcriptional regulator [Limimaricola litoreus]|uniref:TetR/AcrR family transcriptional regulator n=1 Tax=Limimaricola litoreus TaxID=2955316 RepID=A0A9X2JNT1_9RHOB|nr:TetR/AcrR family transcriptional regulator [Limimaricola litoreus]MCP1167325.1 TetR/AcrR family transcriptional regulator [Limimaricola litoreus]
MKERRSNADRSNATRHALLDAARELFLSEGFTAVGTPVLVKRVGLTRGALYHHFADKQALFLAVVEEEAARIAVEIEDGSAGAGSSLDALIQGANAYFRAMEIPGRVRLMLLDGPAVLGPDEMRRIDRETGGRELRHGLAEVMRRDGDDPEVEMLADLVSAMFDRAVLARDVSTGPGDYREMVAAVLKKLVREGK